MSLDNLTSAERNQWFRLGQAVRRGVGARVPVAWSYNGIIAPALPDIEFKYALMASGNTSFIPALERPILHLSNSADGGVPYATDSGSVYMPKTTYTYILSENNEWELDETWNYTGMAFSPSFSILPAWSNFDLEGIFTASDPVPIYE